jgi:uncharacterized damage-inducible protein DinB
MNSHYLRLMAKYRAWADKLTFDAVAALPAGEPSKERPTLFKSIMGTLNHNHVVDLIWQAHVDGRPHDFAARNLVLYPHLADLWAAQQKINTWFVDWAQAKSASSFQELVRFTFISGEAGAMTRGEMLLHVVNHATYHRGWVAEMFFAVPARNPTTDLPVFLQEIAARQ